MTNVIYYSERGLLSGYWVASTTSPVKLGPYRSHEHARRDIEAMAPRLVELEGPGAADIMGPPPFQLQINVDIQRWCGRLHLSATEKPQ